MTDVKQPARRQEKVRGFLSLDSKIGLGKRRDPSLKPEYGNRHHCKWVLSNCDRLDEFLLKGCCDPEVGRKTICWLGGSEYRVLR